ncbi:uncharacterized protein LOC128210322 [Mya arenaria]|uniref:uncharacterized protein LOC128210322 n=1 Tax=Mya arenaria TaxID=6604 RepID=UPI0022E94D7E|nr:uncharacterized protein LOC128210322 [Mya arenaria]
MEPTTYSLTATSSSAPITTAATHTELLALAWIIPTVLGVIFVLVFLALLFFYCIKYTELWFLRRCPECCCCCLPGGGGPRDEYIHLNSSFDPQRDDSFHWDR